MGFCWIMILISHRGNISKVNDELENSPRYIDIALDSGFYVEIDLWKIGAKLYLGHDKPEHLIDEKYLNNEYFYVHSKNDSSLQFLNNSNLKCNYFWHQSDTFTLTSNNKVWVHVNKKLIKNCICCLPEQYSFDIDLSECYGICSDYIKDYLPLLAPR